MINNPQTETDRLVRVCTIPALKELCSRLAACSKLRMRVVKETRSRVHMECRLTRSTPAITVVFPCYPSNPTVKSYRAPLVVSVVLDPSTVFAAEDSTDSDIVATARKFVALLRQYPRIVNYDGSWHIA